MLTHTSASQLTNYTRCQTKWWIETIKKQRPPASTAQTTGTLWHQLLEHQHNNQTNTTESITSIITPEYDKATTEDQYHEVENIHAWFNILLPKYREYHPLEHEHNRELNFKLEHLLPIPVEGCIDVVTNTTIADDKLLNARYHTATKRASLAIAPQTILYLLAAIELDLPRVFEYRVVYKPTINIRRSRQPETREDYEMRLWDHVEHHPERYFHTSQHELTEGMRHYYTSMLHAIIKDQMELAAGKRVPILNQNACTDYGGCYHLSTCTNI